MGHASPVLDEALIQEVSSRTRPPAEFHFHSLVLSDPEKIAGRRSLTFGVSVALHSLLAVAMVVLPLLFYDVLPGEYALKTFFVAPLEVAPPAPPPPPPPAGVSRRVAKPAPAVEVARPSSFLAPIEVPDEILPEEGLDLGVEGGVPGGVVGGVPGGVVGGIVGGLPAAPPPPARVVRIGGQLVAPRLVRKVPPVFPELAVQSRASAVVILEAEVDTRGYVRSVKVLRGHPLFDEAAMAAVRQWRYQPLLLNGEPTAFILTVTVSFTLQQK